MELQEMAAAASIGAMSVKELKAACTAAGLSMVGCLEKNDFTTLLSDHQRTQTAAAHICESLKANPAILGTKGSLAASEEVVIRKFTSKSGQSFRVSRVDAPPGDWVYPDLRNYKIVEVGAAEISFPEAGSLSFPDGVVHDRRLPALELLRSASSEKRGLDQPVAALIAVLEHELLHLQSLPAHELDPFSDEMVIAILRYSDGIASVAGNQELIGAARSAMIGAHTKFSLPQVALLYSVMFHLHYVCDQLGVIGNARYAPNIIEALSDVLDFVNAHVDRSKYRVLMMQERFAEHIEAAWNIETAYHTGPDQGLQRMQRCHEATPEWLSLDLPASIYRRCESLWSEHRIAYDSGQLAFFKMQMEDDFYKADVEEGPKRNLTNRGLCLKKLTRIDAAFESYSQAFELDPTIRMKYDAQMRANPDVLVMNVESLLTVDFLGTRDGKFAIYFQIDPADHTKIAVDKFCVEFCEMPKMWALAKRFGLLMVRQGALGNACKQSYPQILKEYGDSRLDYNSRERSLTQIFWERDVGNGVTAVNRGWKIFADGTMTDHHGREMETEGQRRTSEPPDTIAKASEVIESREKTVERCHECGKVGKDGDKLKKCAGCKIAMYCDARCQRKHWRGGHKTACHEQAKAARQFDTKKTK